ncbi:MAG TPA: metal ABC transporter substrate-binding protein [Candidatus Limnocylindrales bacterium]|nr:metal ABC transporter substrate-binding protein [Candidatus Limnocylindrales bacterium]
MRPTVRITGLAASIALAGLVAACGAAGGSPDPAGDRVRVVATTTVFADLVAQVGGDDVEVAALVPKGGEVHTFDPTPADVQHIAEADLVVYNGLGLDDWLADLVVDAGTGARLVALAEDLEGVEYLADEGAPNPHLWLDVSHARRYVERIEGALAELDPARAADHGARARASDERLATLDDEAREAIGALPAERRRVVSFHDAFPYFAAAYELEIVGTVVDAPGQDPSAGEIADLVAAIRDAGVSAIFSEAQFSDDLVRTLAEETGVAVVSDLYTDSLGDPPADTYEGMMRGNLERVVEALRG